jgi:Integrase core domain
VDAFKTELIADRVWRTRTQLELAIVEWVGWFNHDRLHEALEDRPPAEFEAQAPSCPAAQTTPATRGLREPVCWAQQGHLKRKGTRMLPLAIAGTGYGLIGLLVIVLLVVLILALVRRA